MRRFKLSLTIIGSLFAIAFGMMPLAASADPCNPTWEFPVPHCERQTQPPLLFNPSTGTGWAFYCDRRPSILLELGEFQSFLRLHL